MQIRDRIKELRRVPASELIPNPKNWRTHPVAQQDALRGVLAEVGYADALIARETPEGLMLVDGHLRAETTPDSDVPVLVLDIDEAEADLMLATLDPLAAMAGRDEERLTELLSTVSSDNATVNALLQTLANGYEPLTLLEAEPEPVEDPGPQIDRADELREKWQTERGQVWEVGRHRLMCGDATDEVQVIGLCGEITGIFTSPPYAEQRKAQYGGIPSGEYVAWWESVQTACRPVLTPDANWFLNIKPHVEATGCRSTYVMRLVLAMADWGWAYIDEFCWLRGGVPKAVKYRFKNAFEPVYQFAQSPKGFKFRPEAVKHDSYNVPVPRGPGVGDTNWAGLQGSTASTQQGYGDGMFGVATMVGEAYPSNVIRAFSNNIALNHPAAFAVKLVEFFMLGFSDIGDSWYDPFIGSGTTMVAAEQLGRICYGMEIEPKYVAVTLERMAGMGLEPKAVKD